MGARKQFSSNFRGHGIGRNLGVKIQILKKMWVSTFKGQLLRSGRHTSEVPEGPKLSKFKKKYIDRYQHQKYHNFSFHSGFDVNS